MAMAMPDDDQGAITNSTAGANDSRPDIIICGPQNDRQEEPPPTEIRFLVGVYSYGQTPNYTYTTWAHGIVIGSHVYIWMIKHSLIERKTTKNIDFSIFIAVFASSYTFILKLLLMEPVVVFGSGRRKEELLN